MMRGQTLGGTAIVRISDAKLMFNELLIRLNAEVTENAFAAEPIRYGILGALGRDIL